MKRPYTSAEQAKKLAKILPFTTADMCYVECGESGINDIALTIEWSKASTDESYFYTPCWSLVKLFDLINCDCQLEKTKIGIHGKYQYAVDTTLYRTQLYDNPMDAVIEVIEHIYKTN